MKLVRFFAVSSLIVSSAAPVIVAAQATSGAQLFTSMDNSFPGGAGLAGFGLTVGNGAIGIRGSFGVGLSSFNPSGSSASTPGRRWTADGDIVLGDNFGGLAGILGGYLEPYAFAGVGAQSVTSSPSMGAATRTWSYGGGVTIPLTTAISLAGEARVRDVLGGTPASSIDFARGNEYRVGISFRFGSGRSSVGSYGSRSRGSSPPRPTGGITRGRTTWPASSTNASAAARRVVTDAEQYIGVPYVYGGSSPKGFDCSGFVQYVYARQGVDLPRTSRQMAGAGIAIAVRPSAMTVGDLMLFEQGGRISHVAIYAGSGRFIHSSSSGGGVRYDDLNTQRGRWFADHMVAVRRVAGDGRAVMSAFASLNIPFDHFDPPDSAPPVKKR